MNKAVNLISSKKNISSNASSKNLVEHYKNFGYATGIDIFTQEEAAEIKKEYDNYIKKYGDYITGKLESNNRFKIHLLAKWAYKIVTAPALLNVVKQLLDTENVLIWSSDINSKKPNTPGFFSWHQDSTYAKLYPDNKVLTAWVALSLSKNNSGCMHFIPASHKSQLTHNETLDQNNMLGLGQTISSIELEKLDYFKESSRIIAELEPGQASIHHWRLVHCSGSNKTDYERIGLAIRYMAADVTRSQNNLMEEGVTLASGEFLANNFWYLERPPAEDYGVKEWDEHDKSVRKETENYFRSSQVFKEFKEN